MAGREPPRKQLRLTFDLAIAASGGADSTALIVEAAARFPSEKVIVLTVDHRTRATAAFERAQVKRLACEYGFAFAELVIEPVTASQAAWRRARYDVLLDYCRSRRVPKLWLGHHADDLIETTAIRLLANGKLPALAGMSAERRDGDILIERPLLNHSARSIRQSLAGRGIVWCEDPSNADMRYRRVAVRALLEQSKYAPSSLVRRTGTWRADLEQLIGHAWQLTVRNGPYGSQVLCPDFLSRLPLPVAAALLKRAAVNVVGREQRVRNVDFASALKSETPPEQLGGARVWPVAEGWLVGRDFRHIQDQIPLSSVELTWDARYRLRLTRKLTENGWVARRLGVAEARRLRLALPAEWAAALLSLWCDDELIAVPDLGVWRGEKGDTLRHCLTWRRIAGADTSVFRVAPEVEAPILGKC